MATLARTQRVYGANQGLGISNSEKLHSWNPLTLELHINFYVKRPPNIKVNVEISRLIAKTMYTSKRARLYNHSQVFSVMFFFTS
jgi:hypothetical protein